MTATPAKADELAEALLDTEKLKALTGPDGKMDPAKLGEFVRDYAQALYRADDGAIAKQIQDGLKAGWEELIKGNGGDPKRLPMGESGVTPPGTYAPYQILNLSRTEKRQIAATGAGPGIGLDGEFANMADFIKATFHGNVARNGRDPRLVKNDYSSIVGAGGGDLIPEVLRAEILRLALETSVVRSRARVIPMDSLTVPFPVIVDSSHASNVFGGIVGTWTPEAGAIAESDASFGRILLQARKLAAYTVVPNELLQDSIGSFEALINALYPAAISYFEDIAFLTGDGAGQPLGVHNADAVIAVGAEAGQKTNTILYENIVNMYSRMLPASLGSAVWVCNIDIFPQLATMALSVGTGGSAVWIGNGGAVGAPPTTILGRPVIFTEKVNSLGTQGDIGFYDFGYYLIGDRMAMSMANSPHFKFQNDQTVYRFIERVDGRPWLLSALTPHVSSKTLSPFVELATRP